MNDSRVLVVGATGQLGGAITRRLIASGVKVRALARSADKLAQFAPQAEVAAIDLRDVPKLNAACRGTLGVSLVERVHELVDDGDGRFLVSGGRCARLCHRNQPECER